jgi:hypothetical protein
MAEFAPGLPIPLLLLVHLHILEYPLANNPEYDHNMFDPNVRGLRDRLKSMEDMCYFLVGKVEGRKESAKAVRSNCRMKTTQNKTIPTDSSSVPVSYSSKHDCVSHIFSEVFGGFAPECYLLKDWIRICGGTIAGQRQGKRGRA